MSLINRIHWIYFALLAAVVGVTLKLIPSVDLSISSHSLLLVVGVLVGVLMLFFNKLIKKWQQKFDRLAFEHSQTLQAEVRKVFVASLGERFPELQCIMRRTSQDVEVQAYILLILSHLVDMRNKRVDGEALRREVPVKQEDLQALMRDVVARWKEDPLWPKEKYPNHRDPKVGTTLLPYAVKLNFWSE